MGIFDIFSSTPKNGYSFKNEKHFRGFKRSGISSHYGQAPANLKTFWHKDITGMDICFMKSKNQNGEPMLSVYLSGKLIAHVWNDMNTYERITSNQVEAVHLRLEDDIGLDGQPIGPRPRLFVKLKEA